MVPAVRYPPAGIRGVATARGARWGRVDDYWTQADDEMCVIAQIESLAGLEQLEAIADVEGIDALFVGPSDLGAALGYLGQPNHPVVKAEVSDALARIRATGKAAGVLESPQSSQPNTRRLAPALLELAPIRPPWPKPPRHWQINSSRKHDG